MKRRTFGEKPELLFQILHVKMRHTQRPFPPSNIIDILCSVYQMPFRCSREKSDFAQESLPSSLLLLFTLNFIWWHLTPPYSVLFKDKVCVC